MFEQIIPYSGAELIAKASMSNQIVIDKVVASSNADYTIQELKNDPNLIETYAAIGRSDTVEGDIDGAFVQRNDDNTAVARVVGSLGPTNEEEYPAHMICIWAHPANGDEYDINHPKPLVWAYSQTDTLVIPASVATVRAIFNIAVLPDTVMDSVSHGDGYVTIGEATRFMTTHLAGDMTRGQFQYVRGDKHFKDKIIVGNEIKFSPGQCSIENDASNDSDKQGIFVRVNTYYDDDVDSVYRLFSVVDEDSGDDIFGVYWERDHFSTHVEGLMGSYGNNIRLFSNIVPDEAYNQDLGISSLPFDNVWAAITNTNYIRTINGEDTISVDTSNHDVKLVASSNNHKLVLGSTANKADVYAERVSTGKLSSPTQPGVVWIDLAVDAYAGGVVLTPNIANTAGIGSADKPFKQGRINDLYTTNLYINNQRMNYVPNIPNTPTSGDTANVLIGSTVMAMGTYGDFGKGAGSSIQYGERITVPSSRIHVAANRAGSFTISNRYIPSGTYVAISEADFGTGANDRSVVTLIRIG